MPEKFGVNFANYTTSTARKTCAKVVPAANKPCEFIEFALTGAGQTTAADTQHEGGVTALTNAGAGTGVSATPNPFQQTGAVSASTCLVTHTTEPTTYTTISPIYFGFNQRGGMRWAVPKGEGVLISQGDTNLAIGLNILSAAAGAASGYLNWWENV